MHSFGLSLETFLQLRGDGEVVQYRVLNELKKIRENFSNNKLYPDLARLVDLHATLTTIVSNADGIREVLPRSVKGVDVKQRKILFDDVSAGPEDLKRIEELIQWAIPHVQDMIEEGATIYEFVDEHSSVEVVGILPAYLEEGYFFIPDHKSHRLHLLQYEVSIYTSANERFRSLKTRLIDTVEQSSILKSTQAMKRSLIEKNPDLPNPATYSFETEFDFPYSETTLPIAKRKLLQQLYS